MLQPTGRKSSHRIKRKSGIYAQYIMPSLILFVSHHWIRANNVETARDTNSYP